MKKRKNVRLEPIDKIADKIIKAKYPGYDALELETKEKVQDGIRGKIDAYLDKIYYLLSNYCENDKERERITPEVIYGILDELVNYSTSEIDAYDLFLRVKDVICLDFIPNISIAQDEIDPNPIRSMSFGVIGTLLKFDPEFLGKNVDDFKNSYKAILADISKAFETEMEYKFPHFVIDEIYLVSLDFVNGNISPDELTLKVEEIIQETKFNGRRQVRKETVNDINNKMFSKEDIEDPLPDENKPDHKSGKRVVHRSKEGTIVIAGDSKEQKAKVLNALGHIREGKFKKLYDYRVGLEADINYKTVNVIKNAVRMFRNTRTNGSIKKIAESHARYLEMLKSLVLSDDIEVMLNRILPNIPDEETKIILQEAAAVYKDSINERIGLKTYEGIENAVNERAPKEYKIAKRRAEAKSKLGEKIEGRQTQFDSEIIEIYGRGKDLDERAKARLHRQLGKISLAKKLQILRNIPVKDGAYVVDDDTKESFGLNISLGNILSEFNGKKADSKFLNEFNPEIDSLCHMLKLCLNLQDPIKVFEKFMEETKADERLPLTENNDIGSYKSSKILAAVKKAWKELGMSEKYVIGLEDALNALKNGEDKYNVLNRLLLVESGRLAKAVGTKKQSLKILDGMILEEPNKKTDKEQEGQAHEGQEQEGQAHEGQEPESQAREER